MESGSSFNLYFPEQWKCWTFLFQIFIGHFNFLRLILYVWVFCLSVLYMYYIHTRYLQRWEESISPPGTGVTDDCKPYVDDGNWTHALWRATSVLNNRAISSATVHFWEFSMQIISQSIDLKVFLIVFTFCNSCILFILFLMSCCQDLESWKTGLHTFQIF